MKPLVVPYSWTREECPAVMNQASCLLAYLWRTQRECCSVFSSLKSEIENAANKVAKKYWECVLAGGMG